MNLELRALADLGRGAVPNALFLTVSGSHLYGFSSVDSDVDLRGAFLTPLEGVVGLIRAPETIQPKLELAGVEVELVAHDLGKYLLLMSRHNGYVLEQVFSPLVVTGAEFLAELRPLAQRCVTRGCYHHYRGFLQSRLKLLEREPVKTAKALLYAYRVVLTGVHLLRTGAVEAHLPTLADRFGLAFIPELVARKAARERGELAGLDWEWHRAELARWEAELDRAHAASTLPEEAPREELHRFLVARRLGRPQS